MKWGYSLLAFLIFFICPIGASISILERGRSLITYTGSFIITSFCWIFGVSFISELLLLTKTIFSLLLVLPLSRCSLSYSKGYVSSAWC